MAADPGHDRFDPVLKAHRLCSAEAHVARGRGPPVAKSGAAQSDRGMRPLGGRQSFHVHRTVVGDNPPDSVAGHLHPHRRRHRVRIALVPAGMARVAVAGAVFRPVLGASSVARLALATRRGETDPIIRLFLPRALA